ncbi:unnamed protein product [Cylindrotheca closterium]|uniref:MalT-like TPR region domain-containing protein n=1 Tax=Cylindrotheca closterium TaxID=2856 RepID=A0AAD2CH53_9STRA|nr:unnamed protein product [Cylindrotheca closterium]
MMEPLESDPGLDHSYSMPVDQEIIAPPSSTNNTTTSRMITTTPVMDMDEAALNALEGFPHSRPLAFLKSMIQECLCDTFAPGERAVPGVVPMEQFIQLTGVEYIGLGTLGQEASAKEKAFETLEQIEVRSTRMISIGYLMDDDNGLGIKKTQKILLDVWNEEYPDDRAMSRTIRKVLCCIQYRDYVAASRELERKYDIQQRRITMVNNAYMVGITAHNLGVLSVLMGKQDEAMTYFEEAVAFKREAFGKGHIEIAPTLDELGVQLFTRERYGEAVVAFKDSFEIVAKNLGTSHRRLSALKNNIACCYVAMGNMKDATAAIEEALGIIDRATPDQPSVETDWNYLYRTFVLNNSGYIRASAENYKEAKLDFEEILRIQIQNPLFKDLLDHRFVRDSTSNFEFVSSRA